MSKNTETTDDLQAQLVELQKKISSKALSEEKEDAIALDLPLANITLILNKNNTIRVNNVTPPEVAFFVAEHQKRAGGMPIKEIELIKNEDGTQKYVKTDPRRFLAALCNKFHAKKVQTMYPGSIPTFPTTFKSAMSLGQEITLPSERLMDFEVLPMGVGING